MARKEGFYKVVHHGNRQIMKWTPTNEDNTEKIAGYWNGHYNYSGHDHDLDFINEKEVN